MKMMRTVACSVVILAATIQQLIAANVVLNPGFESGSGADAANWNEIEVAGGSQGAIAIADRTVLNPRTGVNAMDFSVVGAPDFGPVAEIQQQTAVGSIVGGNKYDFSYWVKGIAGPGSVSFYEVLWFDGDGSNGGGPQGSATGLTVAPLNATYTQVGSSGLIAPVGADSVLVQIRLVTGAFGGASGSMSVDDVQFADAIPEPAAVVIALTGVVVLAARRKIKARH